MIIACDPGANGAFVFRGERITSTYKTAKGYHEIWSCCQAFRHKGVAAAAIELIGMRQGDTEKAHAIKELNQNVGRAKLCFELAGIKYQEIDPKTWEYKYGLVGHKDKKSKAKEIAQALYPELKVTLADADAILIADYLWHITYGVPFRTREPKIKTDLTITRVVNDDISF